MLVTVLLTVLLGAFVKCSSGEVKLAIQYNSEPEQRNWIEATKKEYDIPSNESYCILIKKNDAGYANYLGKYIFQTSDVCSVLVDDDDDLNSIDSRYIFLYDQENEIVNTWVRNNYPEQVGNKVIVREEEL